LASGGRELRGQRVYAKNGTRRWEADRIFGDYRRIYEESWKLFPDVLESLEQLADFRLAIITNGDKSNQTHKLDRLGLLAHFEVGITPACAGVAKPSRGIFEFAASVTSTTANECWYVGISLELDYRGALGSGYNSVWLNRTTALKVARTSAETCTAF
jgi:putative hydrolase of the HAD superfamily